MRDDFNIRHWLALSFADGVGAKSMRRLLGAFGSPGAVLSAPAAALKAHVPARVAANIANAAGGKDARIDAAIKWMRLDESRRLLTWGDADYPPLLLETPDPPPLLYARGDMSLLRAPAVAVVGSRNVSAAGARNTRIFARALADAGVAVVSGLAQGADAEAHSGALEGGGRTIAVIGTGMDITYPKINRDLASDIAARGLLLSEFALGTAAMAGNFPRRNRIISGIARGCLIVEATIKSGSLITARLAAEQGREVFAVPGSINSPMHRGCHRLIRDGATLVESVHDILESLNIAAAKPRPPKESDYEALAPDTGEHATIAVLAHVDYAPMSVDDIAASSGMDVEKIMPELLELEVSGKIVAVAGGRYQRV